MYDIDFFLCRHCTLNPSMYAYIHKIDIIMRGQFPQAFLRLIAWASLLGRPTVNTMSPLLFKYDHPIISQSFVNTHYLYV